MKTEARQIRRQRPTRRNTGSSSSAGGGASSSSGIWRLLACTQASEDDRSDSEASMLRRREARRASNWRNATKDGEDDETEVDEAEETEQDEVEEDNTTLKEPPRRSSGKQRHRKQKRLQKPGSRPPPACEENQLSHSKDSFWQRIFRSGGGDVACRGPAMDRDDSTTHLTQRAKSPYFVGRRKRRKRLVVAMLEDDDRATADARSRKVTATPNVTVTTAGGTDSCGIRIRATRDEKIIRRILQKFSDSLVPSGHSSPIKAFTGLQTLPEMQSPPKALVGPPRAFANTVPAQPPPIFQLPSPSCGTKLLPERHANALQIQPSEYSQPYKQQQHQQQYPQPSASYGVAPSPTLNGPPPAPLSHSTPPNHSVQQLAPILTKKLRTKSPQPPEASISSAPLSAVQTEQPSDLGTSFHRHRRGYRLFRRIFSTADNYYAVPFPPLENLKFKEDEDGQWEDLEIYVASHKGLVALKPQQKSQGCPPEKIRLLKGISKGASSVTRAANRLPPQKQLQQTEVQSGTSDRGQPKNNTINRLNSRCLGLAQSAPTLPQHGVRALACDPKTRSGSLNNNNKQQQQQQQQLLQALKFQRFPQAATRRADPLNPGRLLSQLNSTMTTATPIEITYVDNLRAAGASGPTSTADLSAVVSPSAASVFNLVPSYMRPYIPHLQRAKWNARGGGESGVRCGRLTGRLPAIHVKTRQEGGFGDFSAA